MDYYEEGLQEALGATETKVYNTEDASALLRKISFLKRKQAENDALASKEMKRIADWLDKENSSINKTIGYFENELTTFYRLEKDKNPKFKFSSPYGKITSRTTTKYDMDKDALKAWLEEHGRDDLLKVKKDVDLTAVKAAFKDGYDPQTGEIVAGMHINYNHTTVSIKTEDDDNDSN